jgi:hypothetical protein
LSRSVRDSSGTALGARRRVVLGLSAERVRQIEQCALERMRERARRPDALAPTGAALV